MIALISSASSWTATKGITHVLLFDAVHHQVILLGAPRGEVRRRLLALTTTRGGLSSGRHSGMQRGKVAHHLLVLILLIGMDSLSVLTQVIKPRELLATMTSERAFASVFPMTA